MSIGISNKIDNESERIKLRSLTPTDQAENGDFYCKLLKSALDEQKNYNIALTGGYGSGKSSVIETFLKKHKEFKPIRISLAAFNFTENDITANSNKRNSRVFGITTDMNNEQIELEISLLQQFLYQSENWESESNSILDKISFEKKLFISIISLFVLFASFKALWSSRNLGKWLGLDEENYFLFSTIVVIISSIGFLISSGWFMFFLFKLLLKVKTAKIDIQPISLEISQGEKISMLNTHLFQIVKLFKNSNYNIVILEDIDRLENHKLFEKLREINNILRYNPDTSNRSIRFLYSLKESVFEREKDKNKFFDIIIPVVPYINHLNSKDKFESFIKDIEPYYNNKLREVIQIASLCIDDMRTIVNISNEYLVYKTVTGSKELDPEKLLAIITYKNIFPSDFEKMHSGNSELQKIFDKRQEIINKKKENISDQIDEIEDELESIQNEEKVSIDELREQYIMGFLKKLDEEDLLLLNGKQLPIKSLLNDENFELVIKNGLTSKKGYTYRFSDVEEEVNSNFGYLNRLQIIDNKANQAIKLLEKHKANLKSELARVDSFPFSKLVSGQKLFNDKDYGFDSQKLQSDQFKYDFIQIMLTKGYITPDYKYWISIMHEGSLSPNDREFVFSIKKNLGLKFDTKLDDIQSIVNELFSDDWGSLSVLNFEVFNFVLKHNEHRNKLIPTYDIMKINSKVGLDFVIKYYDVCNSKREFTTQLLLFWNDFILIAIQSGLNIDKFLPSFLLSSDLEVLDNQNLGGVFTEFINESENFIDSFKPIKLNKVGVQKIKNALMSLNVKLKSFRSEVKNELIEAIYDIHAFELNLENTQSIIKLFSKDFSSDLSYSSIISSELNHLKDYIEEDINIFIEEVLIPYHQEKSNWKEDKVIVLKLLNHNELNDSVKKSIIELVNPEKLDFVNIISTDYWSDLIKHGWISSKWTNLLHYFDTFDKLDDDLLVLLNDIEWLRRLIQVEKLNVERAKIDKLIGHVLLLDIQRDCLIILLRKYGYYIAPTLIVDNTKVENIKTIIDIEYFQFNVELYNTLKRLHISEKIHLYYASKFQNQILEINQLDLFYYSKEEYLYVLKNPSFTKRFLYIVLIENIRIIQEFNREEAGWIKLAIERCGDFSSIDLLLKTMERLNFINQIPFFNSIASSGYNISEDNYLNLIRLFVGDKSKIAKVKTRTILINTKENKKFAEYLKQFGLINKIQEDTRRKEIYINRNNN